jgi:hypothetical protein
VTDPQVCTAGTPRGIYTGHRTGWKVSVKNGFQEPPHFSLWARSGRKQQSSQQSLGALQRAYGREQGDPTHSLPFGPRGHIMNPHSGHEAPSPACPALHSSGFSSEAGFRPFLLHKIAFPSGESLRHLFVQRALFSLTAQHSFVAVRQLPAFIPVLCHLWSLGPLRTGGRDGESPCLPASSGRSCLAREDVDGVTIQSWNCAPRQQTFLCFPLLDVLLVCEAFGQPHPFPLLSGSCHILRDTLPGPQSRARPLCQSPLLTLASPLWQVCRPGYDRSNVQCNKMKSKESMREEWMKLKQNQVTNWKQGCLFYLKLLLWKGQEHRCLDCLFKKKNNQK